MPTKIGCIIGCIAAELEQGVRPWLKRWDVSKGAGTGWPGINIG